MSSFMVDINFSLKYIVMRLRNIIKEIPSSLFDFLSKSLKCDYKAKKLTSKNVFMVILHSMFAEKNFSLRKLKENFDNKMFQKKILGKDTDTSIHHTSFHYRLNNINYVFFKNIYDYLLEKCKNILEIKFQNNVLRFDSTLVNISSKLINNIGFNQSGDQVKSTKVKFTIGHGEIPETVKIFTTKDYKSEDIALKEAILSQKIPRNQIILFDRGISSRETFDIITKNGNLFISRLKPIYRVKTEEEKIEKKETLSLKILKEINGKLYIDKDKLTDSNYRIIHAKQKNKLWDDRQEASLRRKMKSKKHEGKTKEEVKKEMLEEELIFVTNIPSKILLSEDIVLLYKKRWDIEVLFKFLKQELHFSHLINNSENGIKVMVYMTLIFSLLLLLYKKKNNLSGYKMVKHRMLLELWEELCRFAVIMSGGCIKKWEESTGTFW